MRSGAGFGSSINTNNKNLGLFVGKTEIKDVNLLLVYLPFIFLFAVPVLPPT